MQPPQSHQTKGLGIGRQYQKTMAGAYLSDL